MHKTSTISVPSVASLLPTPDALKARAATLETYKETRRKWESDRVNAFSSGSLARHLVEDVHEHFRQGFGRVVSAVEARKAKGETPLVTPEILRALSRNFQGLLGHHNIEDTHFFPTIRRKAPALAADLDVLEADHQRLHPLEDAILASGTSDADRVAALTEFVSFLNDHLNREEMLVVPVLLQNNGRDQWF